MLSQGEEVEIMAIIGQQDIGTPWSAGGTLSGGLGTIESVLQLLYG